MHTTNQTTTHTSPIRFVERQDQILALKLGWVAGEHVFFLGPPGTGKSALVEEFTSKMGVRVFKALMTPFTTPEEIFGPIDIPHMRETGRVRRITEGFLPEAEVAFLDEIFKANSAILNSLLRIMQEREFAEEPPKMKKVPTRMIVGASNELPSGEELKALYDRFLIRSYVPYLSDAGFQRLLRGDGEEIPDDLRNMEVPEDLEWISIEEEVYDLLFQVRKDLLQEGIILSDRRWKKTLNLMRAHALLQGRPTVNPEDLDILRFVAWEKPDQIQKVKMIVLNRVAPEIAEAQELISELEKRYAEIDSSNMAAVAEFLARAKTAQHRLDKLAKTAPESARTRIQSMRASIQELQKNAVELLGIER